MRPARSRPLMEIRVGVSSSPNLYRTNMDGRNGRSGLGDYAYNQTLPQDRDRRRGLFLRLHSGNRPCRRLLQWAVTLRRGTGCRSARRTSPRPSPHCRTTSTRSNSVWAARTPSNFLNQYQQAGGQATCLGGSSTPIDQTVLSAKGRPRRR